MHDARDFRRAALGGDGVFNFRFLYAEMLIDQRCKGRHGTSLRTAENGAERRGLLFIGTLIDIARNPPVTLSHDARRIANQVNVQPVERYLAVAALVDMED